MKFPYPFGNGPRSLTLSLILFLISLKYALSAFSNIGAALIAAQSATIILYIAAYGLSQCGKNKNLPKLNIILFHLSLLLFLASSWIFLSISGGLISAIATTTFIATYFTMFLLLFSIAQIYFMTNNTKIRCVVIAAVVIITVLYLVPNVVKFVPDDEIIIAYYGIEHLFAGVNPYTQSVTGILYNYHQINKLSLTISTNNTIIGVMDYPALFFLVQAPFYLIAGSSAYFIPNAFLHIQAMVFFLIMILAYFMVSGKKQNSGPDFMMYLSLAFAYLFLSSLVLFLMIAMIVFMYSKLSEKYSWLILGLMISMQEQLWTVALLFLIYSFNNYGMKRGLRDLLGAAAVFIVINGIFIINAPSSFVHDLIPEVSSVLPNPYSPLSFIAATYYPAPLQAFSYLFIISIILFAIVSLYVNDKKLIPLFGTMPFLFLGHAILTYFALPIVAFAMIVNSDLEKGARNLSARVFSRKIFARNIAAAIAVCILAMLVLFYACHSAYNSNFGVYASNISVENATANTLTYHAQLSYNVGNATPTYLIMSVSSNASYVYYGFFNQSLINGSLKCAFPCSLNVNRIILSGSGSYNLTATMPSNMIKPAYISAIITNSKYYYRSAAVEYG